MALLNLTVMILAAILMVSDNNDGVFAKKYPHTMTRNSDDNSDLSIYHRQRALKHSKDSKNCVEFKYDGYPTYYDRDDPRVNGGASGYLNEVTTPEDKGPFTFENISFSKTKTKALSVDLTEGTAIFQTFVGTVTLIVEDDTYDGLAHTMFILTCAIEEELRPGCCSDQLWPIQVGNCCLSGGTGIFAGATGECFFSNSATDPILRSNFMICLAE